MAPGCRAISMLLVWAAVVFAALRDTRDWLIRTSRRTAASWLSCGWSRARGNSSSWMRNRCWRRGSRSRRGRCASLPRSAMRTTSLRRLVFRLTAGASPWSGGGEEGRRRIVIVDRALQGATVVATSPTGRNVAPEWFADGARLVFASDRDGAPFALYETSSLDRVQEPRPVLRVAGGARSPAVAPDGRVVFVGYTADGFDLFEDRAALLRRDTAVATPCAHAPMRPCGHPPVWAIRQATPRRR